MIYRDLRRQFNRVFLGFMKYHPDYLKYFLSFDLGILSKQQLHHKRG